MGRSRSLGDKLDIRDSELSVFFTPPMPRSRLTSQKPTVEGGEGESATLPSPRSKARKQRLDMSQMLQSAKGCAPEFPSLAPTRLKIHKPQFIPKLNLDEYATERSPQPSPREHRKHRNGKNGKKKKDRGNGSSLEGEEEVQEVTRRHSESSLMKMSADQSRAHLQRSSQSVVGSDLKTPVALHMSSSTQEAMGSLSSLPSLAEDEEMQESSSSQEDQPLRETIL